MTDRNELESLLAADKTARGFDAHVVSFEMADHLRNNAQHYLSLMDEVERLREALEASVRTCPQCDGTGAYDFGKFSGSKVPCEFCEVARQALGETHDN